MPPLRQLLDYTSTMSHRPPPLSHYLNRSAGHDQLYPKSALKKTSNVNNTKNKMLRNREVVTKHRFYEVCCIIVQSLIPLTKFNQGRQITIVEQILPCLVKCTFSDLEQSHN